MSDTSNRRRAVRGAAVACAALAPLAALAQGPWQYEAALNGWLPAITGTVSVPSGGGADIDVSMGDVLDALQFTVQGSFEARRDRWGVWTDLVYANFGATKNRSRDFEIGGRLPAGLSANLDLDVESWIWTIGGLYNLVDGGDARADVVFGARLLDMSNDLDWTLNGDIAGLPLPGRSGSGSVGVSNWDAVVGIKGRMSFGAGGRWFVPYYADVGTGESDLTWQLIAGVGYRFDWGSLTASWRYLAYDFGSSAPFEDIRFNGPVVGAVFRW